MNQTPNTDADLRAIERVVGLESDDPPSAAARTEADIRAEAFWTEEFAALLSIPAPVQPSTGFWQRISSATVGEAASAPVLEPKGRGGLAALWESVNFWRFTTAVAAACLLVALFVPGMRQMADPGFRAVLQSPAEGSPGWLVEISADRSVRLIPLTDAPPPGDKVFQFWTLWNKEVGPKSLGVVPAGQTSSVGAASLPIIAPGQLFEITLEPSGGSPIGRPTGEVLFKGLAIEVPRARPS